MSGWIVASALLERPVDGLPYPCLCEIADPDPPGWKLDRALRSGDPVVYICDPYLAKKGRHAGQWCNRCPCWGMPRVDDRTGEPRPDGCCAWSEHNPAYASTTMRGIEWRKLHGSAGPGDHGITGSSLVDASPGQASRVQHPSQPPRPGDHGPFRSPVVRTSPGQQDNYEDEWDYTLDPGPDDHRILPRSIGASSPGPEVVLEPYTRRWSAVAITCPCETPWDGVKDARQVGHHCTGCCQNFKSQRVAAAHQKLITDRCKDPAQLRNVDGLPVYRAVYVGPFIVWQ